jgi:type II secretory pathway pseudopilin PulG
VIIIGILAAIAIPVYLGVQNNAKDASVKSDLANAKTAIIALQTESGEMPATAVDMKAADVAGGLLEGITSYGFIQGFNTDTIGYKNLTTSSFCIGATSTTGAEYYVTASLGITDNATALYLSNDARSRETATNLAAQEIDLARSAGDVFSVLSTDTTVEENGTTFTVHRATDWETTSGADGTCGSGGGQLRYRRVNVTVTWNSMRASTPVVRADSALAPGRRINDPMLGTILVSVLTAAGSGAAGVTISAVPNTVANGAEPLLAAPPKTNPEGCSYLLKVKPGTYDVSALRTNFVDKNQATTSVTAVGVAAGAAASVSFAYDLAGTLTVDYATDVAGTTLLPNDLHTTWRSTYAAYTPLNVGSVTPQTFRLHPFGSGYQVFAGSYLASTPVLPATPSSLGCIAVDPAAWTVPADDGAIGLAAAQVATFPGGGATVNVPLGVFTVSGRPWFPGST